MSGSGTENGMAADFAALLRELKERSGLSYGVLAKRLHMSTSTLHRYCNGDAVPTDYAPVERLARLCKAAPEELVELHRRWVLADATRGRKGVEPGVGTAAGTAAASTSDTGSTEGVDSGDGPVPAEALVPADVIADGRSEARELRLPSRRRTRVALVGAAVAAVLGAVTLATSLPSGGEENGRERRAGAVSAGAGGADEGASESPSPSSASPSASAGKKGKDKVDDGKGAKAGASASGEATPRSPGSGGADSAVGVPLTVKVEPYTWESPCSQRYLIDRAPGKVGPPPPEQDARAWVDAAGAVSSGQQYVTLTVQGTGAETVVVDSLKVRMIERRSPLAWNDYTMGYPGVGCGAGVPTRSFTVALDAMRPEVVPAAGSKDFPYSVSESDPEVYYITADASAYYVSWHLELKWSSGSRSGTLTVDDNGTPFRTSGNNGRPAYEYPLGGPKWVEEGTTLGDQGAEG
ncbi:transcriptional regulator [Streptomyces capitiformicae]|uniref:Transcriptional regulator n=2 Tax=Streptomyces capitiformicae TaxID=2014920 RepID=A0A919GQ04_9ACTN|nr:transcriptional regulator [Streptomyces capitiformicae]